MEINLFEILAILGCIMCYFAGKNDGTDNIIAVLLQEEIITYDDLRKLYEE